MSKDIIYRQDAIEMFQREANIGWNYGVETSWAEAFKEAAEMVEKLPSAESNIVTVTIGIDEKRLNEIIEEAERRLAAETEEAEPKRGKWLDDCGGVKCSVCGHTIDDPYYVEDYCTKCGSFNGEEEE